MPAPKSRSDPAPLPLWTLAALGVLVGVIGGLGAVVFRWMIGAVHNLLFLGSLSLGYDANVHTPPGPWGAGIVLVPVIGAVCVAFLVKTFAPEARGHGVPEVLDAIYYGRGRIRPVVAAVKSLASAISIGSGGSVGREGPIIQIGSTFGSVLGQWLPMPAAQRVNLVAAGAGAGIAATFNTPIGGVLFAMELMMTSIRASTVLPVFLAAVTATYLGRLFLGESPAFDIPAIEHPGDPIAFVALPVLVAFGLVLGSVSALFVRSIYWFEDLFDRIPGNAYTRHMLGMLIVGVMIYLLMRWTGHYYVQGVGYATIQDVLSGALTAPGLLLLLVALKLLATGLTLGSGASGGVFSPGLFIGAGLGGALGGLLQSIDPAFPIQPSLLAVAGMAAMIGGTTGAVATATIMVFEMTRDLDAVLPVLITVATAAAIRVRLSPASIYTLKLLRRGHVVPEGLQSSLAGTQVASQTMSTHYQILAQDALAGTRVRPGIVYVVHESGAIRGTLGPEELQGLAPSDPMGPERLNPRFALVGESENVFDVLAALDEADARLALVMRSEAEPTADAVLGIVTLEHISGSMKRHALLYR